MRLIELLQSNKHFCGTVGSLSLGALSTGMAMGWPNPSFNYLYDGIGSPVLAYLDKSWMESTINIGASLGSLLSILINDLYGRRVSFAVSAGVHAAFWLFLINSGGDRIMIISAACVAGVGVGIFTVTTIVYVAEISSPSNRGLVGTFILFSGNLGKFGMNLIGTFVDIKTLQSAMVAVPLSFLVTIYFWMIESPYYLFKQGTVLEAKLRLKQLHDRKSVLEIDEEYKSMCEFFNSSITQRPIILLLESIFPSTLHPLISLTVPILCMSQMFGVVAIGDYAQRLVEQIFPHMGELATSSIDVVSIIFCLFAMQYCGRKSILVVTIVGSALCCLFLAIDKLASEDGCNMMIIIIDRKVTTVVMLCIYYAIYSFGLIPVLPIVTGEIFPCRMKTTAVGICMGLIYLVAFCMDITYRTISQYVDSCVAFICYTLFGAVGLPLAIAVVPIKQRKSLSEIQNDMDNFALANY